MTRMRLWTIGVLGAAMLFWSGCASWGGHPNGSAGYHPWNDVHGRDDWTFFSHHHEDHHHGDHKPHGGDHKSHGGDHKSHGGDHKSHGGDHKSHGGEHRPSSGGSHSHSAPHGGDGAKGR